MGNESVWDKDHATDPIRAIARSRSLTLHYRLHARERLAERGLLMGDVLHVLKFGFIRQEPIPSTREGFMRYSMECKTPNSNGREVRVVVIPDKKRCDMKIVTVMWVDETDTKAGTIIGKDNEDEEPPLH